MHMSICRNYETLIHPCTSHKHSSYIYAFAFLQISCTSPQTIPRHLVVCRAYSYMYISYIPLTYMHMPICRNHALCTINLPAPWCTSCIFTYVHLIYTPHIYTRINLQKSCASAQSTPQHLGVRWAYSYICAPHIYTSYMYTYIYVNMHTCRNHACAVRTIPRHLGVCRRYPYIYTSSHMYIYFTYIHVYTCRSHACAA